MYVYCLLVENSQISITPTASISEPPSAPAAEKRDPGDTGPVAPPRVTGMCVHAYSFWATYFA